MTPNERADFLAWLNRLSIEQLQEVSGHVSSVLTHKRGMRLRALNPGSQIVFSPDGTSQQVGTVLKVLRSSVKVENSLGIHFTVSVDRILGLHTGHGDFAPLESAAPLPMSGASAANFFEKEEVEEFYRDDHGNVVPADLK